MAQSYVYGSEAPRLSHDSETTEFRQDSREIRTVNAREADQSPALMRSAAAFLMLACLLFSLIWYLSLVSDVTKCESRISAKLSAIDTLRRDNDEKLAEIESSLNLSEIRSIAIRDLGMKYPDAADVITYSTAGDEQDFVKQVTRED